MPWTFYNANGQRLSSAATNISVLDIDGATDIGAAIVDADLFIIDDGAGGTNRKTAASRIVTYVAANAQANQAALAAETNEDTYAPPDLLRHHKGVAKAWAMVAAAGTLNSPSYNVDSVTDTGTGDRTVIFTIDFSNQQYNVHGLSDQNAISIYAERTAAGSSRFLTLNNAATPSVADAYSGMAYFGDH